MDEPFATPADLAARWKPLAAADMARATVLLGDASQLVRDLCPRWAQVPAGTLTAVVCAMVERVLLPGPDVAGVTQQTASAGPFSGTYTFANPTGDLYLTKVERQRLGILRSHQTAFSVDTASTSRDATS